MFGDPPASLPQEIGFLLLPKFSLMAFASAAEPLRQANTQSGRDLYRWTVISEDGRPVTASNGMALVADAAHADVKRCAVLVVCASYDPDLGTTKSVLSWLRTMAGQGTTLGGLDTGSYVLARAGLLDGYKATIHWENLAGLAERFPAIDVRPDIFRIDRNRFTCSGGTAALDMMLHLIRRQHGQALAALVADEFIYARIREPGDPQRMAVTHRLGRSHPKLAQAIEAMEANLEEPLPSTRIAAAAGLSGRQLERLFQRHLNTTPASHYRALRLERARALLRQTGLPVIEVALCCGFASAASFSRAYRARFDHSPTDERRP
jgi:transcriptional regulator GlxA family with amidase domain